MKESYSLKEIREYIHYSDDDLDGVSALILSEHFLKELELSDWNHNIRHTVSRDNLHNKVKSIIDSGAWTKETLLIITDMGVSKETAELIDCQVKQGYPAILIDHHETSLFLNDYSWATVQVKKEVDLDGIKVERLESATSLYARFLTEVLEVNLPAYAHDFSELVRLYDTWEWRTIQDGKGKGKTAKQLNDLFYIYGTTSFTEKIENRFKLLHTSLEENKAFSLTENDYFLLAIEERRIKETFQRKLRELQYHRLVINDKEYLVGIVSVENYHSELGNLLSERRPQVDFIALFDVGRRKISFRTISDQVKVSDVASQFGGGGHAKAAGCSMKREAYETFVLPYFRELNLMRVALG